MAKTVGPLISLDARGSIADTLTYQRWKDRRIVRHYSVPTGLPTDPQITQRGLLASAVSVWRTTLTAPLIRSSWARLATARNSHVAGYHEAMRCILSCVSESPALAVAVSQTRYYEREISIEMVDPLSGLPSEESGEFLLLLGASPRSLAPEFTYEIDEGRLDFGSCGTVGEPLFFQIMKDGVARSGIHRTVPLGYPPEILLDPHFDDTGKWFFSLHWPWNPPGVGYNGAATGGKYLTSKLPQTQTSQYKLRFVLSNIVGPAAVDVYSDHREAEDCDSEAEWVISMHPNTAPWSLKFLGVGNAGATLRLNDVRLYQWGNPPQD